MSVDLQREFAVYAGRRVLVTGHTGFKGGWLVRWLARLGAEVTGYAQAPSTTPSMFDAARVSDVVQHHLGDVRDLDTFRAVWRAARPEIVFHLAAQPIVRESYRDPLGTLTTNVMGVSHALELARGAADAAEPVVLVVITSDKCYDNLEWTWGYRENDRLGGHDPYSASKACAELVVDAYRRSFFPPEGPVLVATVRAGNVIGGGDWTADRLVPDAIRALAGGEVVKVRRASATRPWQHVLEPVSGYLLLGARLLAAQEPAERARLASAWNFGPRPGASRTVADVVANLVTAWGEGRWQAEPEADGLHEAGLLALAVDKAANQLGWAPRWGFHEAILETAAWYRAYYHHGDMTTWCDRQITTYLTGLASPAGSLP